MNDMEIPDRELMEALIAIAKQRLTQKQKYVMNSLMKNSKLIDFGSQNDKGKPVTLTTIGSIVTESLGSLK